MLAAGSLPEGFVATRLGPTDLDDLMLLQSEVFDSITDPAWLRQNDAEMFLDCLKHHVVIGARRDGLLRGIAIMVDAGQHPENIQHYLTEDIETIENSCNLKVVLVATDSRGAGLARSLIERVEPEAVSRGRRQILCTIHPENVPSQQLFERLGYRRQKRVETRYGVRDVLARDLPN